MNNKYYTPQPEELYIGYKYEYRKHVDSEWYEEIATHRTFDDECYYGNKEQIRTKYLTKEDIEECGWKYIEELTEGEYIGYKATRKRGLYPETLTLIWWSNNKLKISSSHLDVVYWGECKSINELWKIQKWLEIMPYKTTDNGQQSEKDKLSK